MIINTRANPIIGSNVKRWRLTERTNGIDIAVMSENVHAGICQESREKKDHNRGDYHQSRVSLQEMLVLIVSRYLKLTPYSK